MSTKRIQFVVAYDGTDFCGWAPQPELRTVRSTLTTAVRQISGEDCEIIGASRTDSGAHAFGQCAHFDCSVPIPAERWPRAINDVLPIDLSVVKAKEVSADFHARFSAVDRFYRYRFRENPRNPQLSRFTHGVKKLPDAQKMNEAGQALIGSHNFWAYSEEVPIEMNPIREIFSLQVRRVGQEVWVDIIGNAFMRGMMRRIAGGLFEVGIGRRPEAEIKRLLDPKKREGIERPVVLPAKGLCLMKVRYGRRPKDFRVTRETAENDFEIAE